MLVPLPTVQFAILLGTKFCYPHRTLHYVLMIVVIGEDVESGLEHEAQGFCGGLLQHKQYA